jgi:hypothetical protein
MADEQGGQNEEGEFDDYEGNDPNDGNDNGETADVAGTTAVVPQPPPPPPVDGEGGNSVVEDYPEDDEPLPDFHVKLIINDQLDGYATDIVTAAITDEFGNPITPTTTWRDSIDGYTQAITQGIQDELTGNQTTVGGKGFFGKSSIEEQEREDHYERENFKYVYLGVRV